MHVLQGAKDVPHGDPRMLLGVAISSVDPREQLAAFEEVHNQVDVSRAIVHPYKPDYERILDIAQDIDLKQHRLSSALALEH